MQNTFYTDSPGDPTYPENLKVKDVNVYIHPSLMLSTHDYSCPVCRERHAVLNQSTGIMQPCRVCEKEYEIVKKVGVHINNMIWVVILFIIFVIGIGLQ